MVSFEDLVRQFCVHECVLPIFHFIIYFPDFEVGFGTSVIEIQGQLVCPGCLLITSQNQIPVFGEIE